MTTQFPAALDVLSNPSADDRMDAAPVPHVTQHANANDAIEALQAKVGIDGSNVPTSLDYRVADLEDTAVRQKEVLSTPITLYVRTNGQNGDGLSDTDASAFNSLSNALRNIADRYVTADTWGWFSDPFITIKVQQGFNAGNINLPGVDFPAVVDFAHPSASILIEGQGTGFTINGGWVGSTQAPLTLCLRNITLTGGLLVSATNYPIDFYLSDVTFVGAGSVSAVFGAQVTVGDFRVSGTSTRFLRAFWSGILTLFDAFTEDDPVITLLGNCPAPWFEAGKYGAVDVYSPLNIVTNGFSVTGSRYDVHSHGTIFANGDSGKTRLPGTTAGTETYGGVYIP